MTTDAVPVAAQSQPVPMEDLTILHNVCEQLAMNGPDRDRVRAAANRLAAIIAPQKIATSSP